MRDTKSNVHIRIASTVIAACFVSLPPVLTSTLLAASARPDGPKTTSSPAFIGNKGSRKIHRKGCVWGEKISPGKRIFFNSYLEAKAAGYTPCGTCRPDLAPGHAQNLPTGDYFGSTKTTTFHRRDCPWAHKISNEHLIVYKSREEAIAAGKKPCPKCKP